MSSPPRCYPVDFIPPSFVTTHSIVVSFRLLVGRFLKYKMMAILTAEIGASSCVEWSTCLTEYGFELNTQNEGEKQKGDRATDSMWVLFER